MIDISDACRAALYKHRIAAVRDGFITEVSFGIIDHEAKGDATYSLSSGATYSNSAGLLEEDKTVTTAYATFEDNYLMLGSGQRIPPETGPYMPQGYISEPVSGADGYFTIVPAAEFVFGSIHSVAGLTFLFDSIMRTAPEEFTVLAYNGGALIKAYQVTGNFDYNCMVEEPFEGFDRLRVEFTKTAPYQRLRLLHVTFGLGYVYQSGKDLISTELESSGHPLNLTIPQKKLTFTLFNEDGKFRVSGENSLVRFLKEGQEATIRYGIYLDGSGQNIEWISGGIFDLESWDTTGKDAKFTANGIFKKLSETTFEKGLFTPWGHGSTDGKHYRSVAELAKMVLDDFGAENYYLNEFQASTTYTYLPIPIVSHAEALQLLGQMINATFEEDGGQKIILRNRAIPDVSRWYSAYVPAYAEASATIYSDHTSMLNDTAVDYASFNDDGFMLGSKQLVPPETAPFQPVGVEYNIYPTGGYYLINGNYLLGVLIDFTQNITFGGIEVDFGEFSGVETAVIIANRSGAGQLWRQTVPVKNGRILLNKLFDNVIWVHVYPYKNSKMQRARIKSIKIKRTIGLDIASDDLLSVPKEKLMPTCRNISSQYRTVWMWGYPHSEELEKIMVKPGELTKVLHSEAYYYVQASCETAGVVFEIAEHYAYVSFIKVSGVTEDVEVVLSGAKQAKDSTSTVTASVHNNGQDIALENPLQILQAQAEGTAAFAADFYEMSNQYEIETLAFPQAQPNDRITYKGTEAIVLKHVLRTGGGAAKSSFTLRGD